MSGGAGPSLSSRRIRDAYTGAVQSLGPTHRGVGWSSLAAQQERLRILLTLLDAAPPDQPVTVADLGCGYGALWSVLRTRAAPPVAGYVGIDLCPAMIAAARDLYGADPRVRLVEGSGLDAAVDYGFVSGTFNYRPGIGDGPWMAHVETALAGFATRCRRGMGFNLLSQRGGRRRESMFYADPETWLRFARALATPRGGGARLITDYLDDDFTVLITFPAATGAAP